MRKRLGSMLRTLLCYCFSLLAFCGALFVSDKWQVYVMIYSAAVILVLTNWLVDDWLERRTLNMEEDDA